MKYTGRAVLVTGGSRGIGAAIVRRLAQEGLKVAFFYHQSVEDAMSLLNWGEQSGFSIVPIQVDLSQEMDVQRALQNAKVNVGPIDYLVNNAAVARYALFSDETKEDMEQIIRTNFESVLWVTQDVSKGMVLRQFGSIVNISSIWGLYGSSCESVYAATKGALISFTKSIAKELGPSNVRVNCIAPGVIDTDMLEPLSKQDIDQLVQRIPLCRLGRPEEVASAVAFLLSDEASYISGSVLEVSGAFIS
ncbi:elongation factor P 5-aminopentanone reductase [Coprothermobacter platensis]|uniref:elongation factor P 5-aminopentanone reductase n=1 Tax=Coprothermobacter platensis TaxID=108819 RepID=UPI00036FE74B|nr:glucose 1-dehydrogenase [Coprothermobacter platensis]